MFKQQMLILICMLIEVYHIFYRQHIKTMERKLYDINKAFDSNLLYKDKISTELSRKEIANIFVLFCGDVIYMGILVSFIFTITPWWALIVVFEILLSIIDSHLCKIQSKWMFPAYVVNCVTCIIIYIVLFAYISGWLPIGFIK